MPTYILRKGSRLLAKQAVYTTYDMMLTALPGERGARGRAFYRA